MSQLPTFLPALFEAFGHQSADVRKVMALGSFLYSLAGVVLLEMLDIRLPFIALGQLVI